MTPDNKDRVDAEQETILSETLKNQINLNSTIIKIASSSFKK